jgi:phosphoglucosamine mutase
VGRAERFDSARALHRVRQEHLPKELTLDGLRVVIDAAHGAAYRVAPPSLPSSARR